MRRLLLLLALALAALQVAWGGVFLTLSSLVGEVREEGVVTDWRLSREGTAGMAMGIAGACLAGAALLLARRRPGLATVGVVFGALLGIPTGFPPLVPPAVLLLPVGLLAIWASRSSVHRPPSRAVAGAAPE